MKILFDRGTPAPLRNALTAHTISTAYEMGWSHLDNGELLKNGQKRGSMLLSQRIRTYGTNKTSNIAGWRFSFCLRQVGQRSRPILSQIIAAVDQLQQGDLCELSFL
jgi:hypothetical protein